MNFEFLEKDSEDIAQLYCQSNPERAALSMVAQAIIEASLSRHIDESRLIIPHFFLENRETLAFELSGDQLDDLADMAQKYGSAESSINEVRLTINQLKAASDLRRAALSIPDSPAELV